MLEVNMKKLILKYLALTLLLLGLFLFSKDSTRVLLASAQAVQGRNQPPTTFIAAQDDAPLRIVSTSVESTEPKNFKLQAMVQNQSNKEIRAYAITSETASAKTQNGYTQFTNLTRRSNIWQPTETRTIEVSDTQDELIVNVRITVDFVEFSDGTTWGLDVNNSRDILAGQREGARVERQRIRQLLKSKGRAEVSAYIRTADYNEVETSIAPNRSQKWLEGFRSGSGSIRGRLKQASQLGDAAQIQMELDKSFDTSEEGQR